MHLENIVTRCKLYSLMIDECQLEILYSEILIGFSCCFSTFSIALCVHLINLKVVS